jgi:hypothetical protein
VSCVPGNCVKIRRAQVKYVVSLSHTHTHTRTHTHNWIKSCMFKWSCFHTQKHLHIYLQGEFHGNLRTALQAVLRTRAVMECKSSITTATTGIRVPILQSFSSPTTFCTSERVFAVVNLLY